VREGEREGRGKRKGSKGKGVRRGDEVEGGIWPTQKFWSVAPYVVDFIMSVSKKNVNGKLRFNAD